MPHYAPNRLLQPIFIPVILFHIIMINFIQLLLLSNLNRYNCVMSITNKFSKKVNLVLGHFAASTMPWAEQLLDSLMIME